MLGCCVSRVLVRVNASIDVLTSAAKSGAYLSGVCRAESFSLRQKLAGVGYRTQAKQRILNRPAKTRAEYIFRSASVLFTIIRIIHPHNSEGYPRIFEGVVSASDCPLANNHSNYISKRIYSYAIIVSGIIISIIW